MDQLLVAIFILALSGISAWLQRRRQGTEDGAPPPAAPPPNPLNRPRRPPTPAPPAAPRPGRFDWERELRRLLEGAEIEPPPPPPRPRQPPAAPPPLPPVVTPVLSEREDPAAAMARFPESAAAHRRAAHIEQSVTSRRKALNERTVAHRPPAGRRPGRSLSPVATAVRAQLRNSDTLRQAMVASVILGPAKALERPQN